MRDDLGSGRLHAGRARRSAELASVVARSAGDRIIADLRRRRGDADATLRFHERNAVRWAKHLGHSKGVLMKAGQLLSFASYGGAMPTEYEGVYQAMLARLRSDAPPMDAAIARCVVEEELGVPVGERFATFEDTPAAAASIGQVHRATLADGTPVAVKVQYPDAAAAIGADLANTDVLAAFLSLGAPMFPGINRAGVRPIAAELRERIAAELDYRLEAENLAFFGDAYRGHPFIRIPAVHREVSTRRVLTMEWIDGARWEQAVAAPAELRARWSEAIYRFAYGSLRRFHRMHADVHPANYLFHDDGTVTFLDFGCVKRFDSTTVARLVALIRALVDEDTRACRRHLVALGYVRPDGDVHREAQELVRYLRALLRPLTAPQPYSYVADDVAQSIRTKVMRPGLGRELDLPPDLVFLERIDIGLSFVLAGLGATNDWRAILDELDGEGPPATDLGRSERSATGDRSVSLRHEDVR